MANQIEGVSDRLIECATDEFLQNGFAGASLRTIAENARTSTNSIYVRFRDKAGLFESIVVKAVEGLKIGYMEAISDFESNHFNTSYDKMFDITDGYIDEMLLYIFDNFKAFRLLICCSEGTRYKDFIDMLAEKESDETIRYIERIKKDSITSGQVSVTLIHMLNTAYFSALFEIVRHEMSKSDAIEYSKQLKEFFRAGWRNVFDKLK